MCGTGRRGEAVPCQRPRGGRTAPASGASRASVRLASASEHHNGGRRRRGRTPDIHLAAPSGASPRGSGSASWQEKPWGCSARELHGPVELLVVGRARHSGIGSTVAEFDYVTSGSARNVEQGSELMTTLRTDLLASATRDGRSRNRVPAGVAHRRRERGGGAQGWAWGRRRPRPLRRPRLVATRPAERAPGTRGIEEWRGPAPVPSSSGAGVKQEVQVQRSAPVSGDRQGARAHELARCRSGWSAARGRGPRGRSRLPPLRARARRAEAIEAVFEPRGEREVLSGAGPTS